MDGRLGSPRAGPRRASSTSIGTRCSTSTAPARPMVAPARRRAAATPACRSSPGSSAPTSLPDLVAECDALADGAFLQDVQGTPYLELPDADAWPAGHPRVTWDRSAVHTVAYDRFSPRTSALRALFEWDGLMELVSRILGRAPLYRYADPLGAMNLAVMHEGDALGWHFDQTDFVVSLAIQPSDARRRVRERAAPALGRRRRHRRALRHRRPGARRRRAGARHHRADDARHAHAVRGPLVAAPRHAGRRSAPRATWRCSATTRSRAR